MKLNKYERAMILGRYIGCKCHIDAGEFPEQDSVIYGSFPEQAKIIAFSGASLMFVEAVDVKAYLREDLLESEWSFVFALTVGMRIDYVRSLKYAAKEFIALNHPLNGKTAFDLGIALPLKP